MNALEKYVLQIIGENTTSPDVFVDTDAGLAPIRDSINDAIEEITMLNGGYRESYRIPLRQDNNFYRLNFSRGRFGWITDAWLNGTKWRMVQTDFNKLNSEDPRWMKHQGNPEQYFHVGMNIVGVYPRSGSNADVIDFKCVVIPDRYTSDTDRIKLRDEYKWAVVHYAVSEYYAGRGDKPRAMDHYNIYLQRLGLREQYQEAGDAVRALKTDKL